MIRNLLLIALVSTGVSLPDLHFNGPGPWWPIGHPLHNHPPGHPWHRPSSHFPVGHPEHSMDDSKPEHFPHLHNHHHHYGNHHHHHGFHHDKHGNHHYHDDHENRPGPWWPIGHPLHNHPPGHPWHRLSSHFPVGHPQHKLDDHHDHESRTPSPIQTIVLGKSTTTTPTTTKNSKFFESMTSQTLSESEEEQMNYETIY